ncbi:Transcriptional regulatory protein OmpR [Ferriphaselus amnicola]|uniref:Transcriptional regulatory protein OmpR n=1 Tax=Ferriphaselus amnicola TaxID=1188319 RepID=A0A2Z6GAG9_9PROT|nr:response regulator transcription factor [Ferriphaselus amnicola]BBE50551.1 Transcriptional regulatory protein OmpR [Ferriphaselus amnicola]
MNHRILIIDDDERLCAMLQQYLGNAGYSVAARHAIAPGLLALKQASFDALVLDLMLPDGDGLDACRQLRVFSSIPVLMLTARGEAMDRILGLEMGADDYLPKPFEPRELLARLKAILRRGTPSNSDVLRFGRLEIDRGARLVRVDGKPCEMTSYQFDLLLALAERPGRVMSREQLLDAVKGEPLEAFDRTIDVHISRIRAAVEDDPKHPRRILTLRGAGYVFARSQDEQERGA